MNRRASANDWRQWRFWRWLLQQAKGFEELRHSLCGSLKLELAVRSKDAICPAKVTATVDQRAIVESAVEICCAIQDYRRTSECLVFYNSHVKSPCVEG